VFVTLNMHPINKPEVIVSFAGEKFDENGQLKDDKTRAIIRELLENLVTLAKKLKV
jgi:chromate reductase